MQSLSFPGDRSACTEQLNRAHLLLAIQQPNVEVLTADTRLVTTSDSADSRRTVTAYYSIRCRGCRARAQLEVGKAYEAQLRLPNVITYGGDRVAHHLP